MRFDPDWLTALVATGVVACLIMGGIMGWAARGMRDDFRASRPAPTRPAEPEGLEVRPIADVVDIGRARVPRGQHRLEDVTREVGHP